MAQGVEKAHAAKHEQNDFSQRDEGVDFPENHGRVADPGFEFVRHRTGHLGLIELHPAHTQKRQNGHGKNDDAHAAQPLNEAAPEQQASGQPLDVGEDRGTRGGKSGNGFEKRIDKLGNISAQDKRAGRRKVRRPSSPWQQWPCLPGG